MCRTQNKNNLIENRKNDKNNSLFAYFRVYTGVLTGYSRDLSGKLQEYALAK